jgi:regulator of replication initiation timing
MSPHAIPSRQAHARSAEILERLMRLRTVLPAMGQELAAARREAARLRVENGRLRARLDDVEANLAAGHRTTVAPKDGN